MIQQRVVDPMLAGRSPSPPVLFRLAIARQISPRGSSLSALGTFDSSNLSMALGDNKGGRPVTWRLNRMAQTR
jgi:hypothetical protein